MTGQQYMRLSESHGQSISPALSNRDVDLREYLRGLRFTELPIEIVEKARFCLIDLIATSVAGFDTPLAAIITQYAQDFHGMARSTAACQPLLGGPRMSAVGAALVGGMIIDSVDSHDGHSLTKGHVGCAVLPALVAVLESRPGPFSGADFMALLVAGYEIGTRAGIALHASAAEYHSSGAWNAITCAALTAHLLDLDDDPFRHALGIAEYHGPRSQLMRDVDYPTMVKDGSGWGAMAGVSAGYLAAKGFTGAPAVSVVSDQLDSIWADLGSRWRILEQYAKPYPVCRWAHPAIDAVIELRAAHEFRTEDVDEIVVHTFHEATRLFQGVPETTDQAQYATAFPTAIAVLHGAVLPEHISDAALGNRAARDMTGRIRFIEDPVFSRLFPERRFARAEIRLRDGQVLNSSPREPRGDPGDPLSQDEIIDKFLRYTARYWSEDKSRTCLNLLLRFGENGTQVADLLNVLRK